MSITDFFSGTDSKIITDLYLCANKAVSPLFLIPAQLTFQHTKGYPEFADSLTSVTYFPFHLICYVENVTEYLTAVSKLQTAPVMEQYKPIQDRFNEIMDGTGDNRTAADACLPIEMAKFAKYALNELGKFDPLTSDLFQEYTRIVLSVGAKLPYVSYETCFQTAGDLMRRGD